MSLKTEPGVLVNILQETFQYWTASQTTKEARDLQPLLKSSWRDTTVTHSVENHLDSLRIGNTGHQFTY